MHFEVPKAKSFKEFGGEYLMIVISILTALALEHAVQTWHRHHVAELAASKINQELRANAEEVAAVQQHNEAEIRKLVAIARELRTGIADKVDDAELMKRLTTGWRDTFILSVKSPALRREAWEAAVASQAASWMPDETLERYSKVYAQMRDVQAIEFGPNGGMDMSRYRDAMSNLEMGLSDPREVYRTIKQMISAYDANGNLNGLRQALTQAAGAAQPAGH
jgi:hypothetical protein